MGEGKHFSCNSDINMIECIEQTAEMIDLKQELLLVQIFYPIVTQFNRTLTFVFIKIILNEYCMTFVRYQGDRKSVV